MPRNKKSKATEKRYENHHPQQNNVLYIIIGILAFFSIFMFIKVIKENSPSFNTLKTKIIPEVVKKVVNNPTTKFEISNVKEANGIVEIELKVGNQKYTSYISRNGKFFFISGVKVDELNKPVQSNTQKSLTCNDVQKVAKPDLTAFVVSNCPYGLQMQRVFKKAVAEIPDLVNYLNIKYIGSIENGKIKSMHGDEEAQENLRQICIREEQKSLYWPYVSCYMQAGKTEECLTSSGVNTSELNACINDANRGLQYAKKDFDFGNKFNAGGSPTLISNGKQVVSEFDFGGRNPNAIKQLICCGSSEKAVFCSNEISKTDVAVSLSLTDDAVPNSEATTGSAGCAPAK